MEEGGGTMPRKAERAPIPDQYVQLLALQLQVGLLLAQLLLQPVVELEQGLVFAVILQGLKERQPSAPSALKQGARGARSCRPGRGAHLHVGVHLLLQLPDLGNVLPHGLLQV